MRIYHIYKKKILLLSVHDILLQQIILDLRNNKYIQNNLQYWK